MNFNWTLIFLWAIACRFLFDDTGARFGAAACGLIAMGTAFIVIDVIAVEDGKR